MLDLFSASAEMEEVKGEDEDFRGWVQSSVVASRALQAAARDLRKKPQDPQIKLRATQAFDQILADCSACHKAYRD
jgi:cytochrome c556